MHGEPDCVSLKNENTFSPAFSGSREIATVTKLATNGILFILHIFTFSRRIGRPGTTQTVTRIEALLHLERVEGAVAHACAA